MWCIPQVGSAFVAKMEDDTFEPEETRRLCRKIELHLYPNMLPGSTWLKLSSVSSHGKHGQYIPDEETLRQNIDRVQQDRNTRHMTVNWRFSTADAPIKLDRLYPSPLD